MRKSIVDAAYEKFKAEVLDRDPVVRGFPFYDIGEFVTVAQLPDLGLKSASCTAGLSIRFSFSAGRIR